MICNAMVLLKYNNVKHNYVSVPEQVHWAKNDSLTNLVYVVLDALMISLVLNNSAVSSANVARVVDVVRGISSGMACERVLPSRMNSKIRFSKKIFYYEIVSTWEV